MQLNKEQEIAVNHFEGPAVLISCPGSGKCITGDSIVFSDEKEKLSYIKDGYNNSNVISLYQENLRIPSICNQKKVEEFYYEDVNETIEIKTEQGYKIEGTKHHPIAVINNIGRFCWKKLEDIEIGDICPIYCDRKDTSFGNDDLFYMMGLLLGDGSISKRDRYFSLSQENNNIAEIYCDLVKKCFNTIAVPTKDHRTENLYSYRVYGIRYKKSLVDIFGDIEHGAKDKYLTKEMLKGNLHQLCSLLRGIYDTDGTVASNGSCIDITLASKKLIDQIHVLLLRFGVFSNKTVKIVKGVEYFRIQIMGDDLRRFESAIGLRHLEKSRRLKLCLSRYCNSNRGMSFLETELRCVWNKMKMDGIFGISERKFNSVVSKDGYVKFNFRKYFMDDKNKRGITLKSLKNLIYIYNSYGRHCGHIEYLSNICKSYAFTAIKSVERVYSTKTVFDFVVPKSHCFIANGFINHNTTTVSARAAKLVEKGVDPKHILCITFTNKAAKEMKERITSVLGKSYSNFFIGTFHALCASLLRSFGKHIGYTPDFTILDEDEQIDIILQVARKLGFDIEKAEAKLVASKINDTREKLLPLSELDNIFSGNIHLSQISKEYILTVKKLNCIDFSGLLSETIHLLKTNENVLDKLQNRWKFLTIDEAQDTNIAQFSLTELISSKHNNIMFIGDTDQSIYSFRGARFQNILDFIDKHKDCKVLYLSDNYRSTPEIVAVADKLIKHNSSHMSSKIFKTSNASGEPVACTCYADQNEEAKCVAEYIQDLVQQGYKYSDFAILYRINSMAQPFESVFNSLGMKYRTVGGFSFYNRAEIKDCICMLRFLINRKDGIAFERVASKMSGLGSVKIGKIENYAEKNSVDLVEACKKSPDYVGSKAAEDSCLKISSVYGLDFSNLHAGESLDKIVNSLNYQDYLKKTYPEDFDDRWQNVKELITAAAIFGEKDPSIAKYVQNLSLLSADDKKEDKDSITLSSGHGAKGKEWNVVFAVGMEQGKLPHARALIENPVDGIEEERRVAFVCLTRAKKILQVSWCKNRRTFTKFGVKYQKCLPSQFLYESGLITEEDFI